MFLKRKVNKAVLIMKQNKNAFDVFQAVNN